MTQPKTVKDLLIFPASFNLSPSAAVDFCLSDPAKSTKCNLDCFNIYIPFLNLFINLIFTDYKIKCIYFLLKIKLCFQWSWKKSNEI